MIAAAPLLMLTACGSDASGTGASHAKSSARSSAGEQATSAQGLAQKIVDGGIDCTTYKPGSNSSGEDWGICSFSTSGGKFSMYTIGVLYSDEVADGMKESSGYRKDALWGPNWTIACEPSPVCKKIQAQIGGTFL